MMKFAIVGGWGAVEKTASRWAEGAVAEEVAARIWVVRDSNGTVIGAIAKDGQMVSEGALKRWFENEYLNNNTESR